MNIFFLLLAFVATLLGALTGMGGGVIIKPVLDFAAQQDAASISILSSTTVFAMSAVALFKGRKLPERAPTGIAVPLSVGAVAGGISGENLFAAAIRNLSAPGVKTTQNIILIGLIALVFLYMLYKEKLPSPHLTGKRVSFLVGLFLGLVSSFLSIGGGPINVAAIVFLFAFSTKTAMQCSLLTIFFSQSAKLITVLMFAGFEGCDLSALPAMVIGGVLGGFAGGVWNKRLSDKSSEVLFRVAQVVIVCICMINIIQSIHLEALV
jgi:uncharacterized membrane protein YfcA